MKKALIIGAAGFVGGYLAEHLYQTYGWEVSVTKLAQENMETDCARVYDLDILNAEAVEALLLELRPDYIFHLAAQSSVAVSWKKPELTVDVNIKGCIHLLNAVRKVQEDTKQSLKQAVLTGAETKPQSKATEAATEIAEASEYKPRILLIGSSEEYGRISKDTGGMVTEETPLHPGNLYAATKVCQNMIGKIYTEAYGMDVMMVRAFNHIGPGQAPVFVASDFCKQVAEIEAGGKEPVMYVGNLSAKRDFTDVRDIVRAYSMLIQNGTAGETYNVGSGAAISMQELLDRILSLSTKEIRVEISKEKLRPVDVPVIEADIRKLQEVTGWKPELSLTETLKEILEYWRKKL